MNKDLKILVVDDEEAYCDVLGMILQTEGYPVRQCIKSKEVIDILKTEEFDLIISDLIMPEMDGITSLKEIKKIDGSAKIIMCSAMGQQAMVIDAIQAGAKDFIVKPFQADRVIEAIKKTLG